MTTATITQQQLDSYKRFYLDDEKVQAVTLEELLEKTKNTAADWDSISFKGAAVSTTALKGVAVTPCQIAVGTVIFDVICLAVSGYGLRSAMQPATAEALARAAAPTISRMETTLAKMAAPNASKMDLAWGVFDILKTIYSGGCLGAVVSAFLASLSWWDAMLYGVTAMATIVAALATDGLAFVAEVVIGLATFGFLVSDTVKACQVCGVQPDPGPGPTPFGHSVAIRTINGHTLTVANNGGLGGQNVPIRTSVRQVGPWERFTVVPIDQSQKTFALKTVNGNYLTAVNGGGIGGPNDERSPVHTDATWIGPWETLGLEPQTDGTYAIRTETGYYLSAVNGGGWGEAANTMPIHTDAVRLGPWETFSLVQLS